MDIRKVGRGTILILLLLVSVLPAGARTERMGRSMERGGWARVWSAVVEGARSWVRSWTPTALWPQAPRTETARSRATGPSSGRGWTRMDDMVAWIQGLH